MKLCSTGNVIQMMFSMYVGKLDHIIYKHIQQLKIKHKYVFPFGNILLLQNWYRGGHGVESNFNWRLGACLRQIDTAPFHKLFWPLTNRAKIIYFRYLIKVLKGRM